VEAGGCALLRALQRGPALQPAAAGAYPWADLRKAGAGIAARNVTPEQAMRLISRERTAGRVIYEGA
jgi:hypothetical protein